METAVAFYKLKGGTEQFFEWGDVAGGLDVSHFSILEGEDVDEFHFTSDRVEVQDIHQGVRVDLIA